MIRRRFTVARLPENIPPEVRKSIRAESRRLHRRSPACWMITLGIFALAVAGELFLLRVTTRYGEIAQDLTMWLPWLPALAAWNFTYNRIHDATRRSIWLAHDLCPDCGYDIRASKERCPECGTQIPSGIGAGS